VTLPQAPIETPRDRFGRYLIAGTPHTRVTTIAGSVDDRHNLEAWKVRKVAEGLALRHDLYLDVVKVMGDSSDPERNRSLDAVCELASDAAGASDGSRWGTEMHALTEAADRGEIVVPTSVAAGEDIVAYIQTMRSAGITVLREYVETIVVLHDLQVAGTLDRIVRVEGRPLPVIADLKTGSSLSWHSIAIQLAHYANADQIYDPLTGLCSAMPAVDQNLALIIHLPKGTATCTLHWVDIAAGWRAAELCYKVRDWRKAKGLGLPFVLTTLERKAWLLDRLTDLRDNYPAALDELAATWPDVPTLKADHQHTGRELSTIAEALYLVEAHHGVPFGQLDPEHARPAPDHLDACDRRLAELPADLRQWVKDQARDKGLPNMRTSKATLAHVDALLNLLDLAEGSYLADLDPKVKHLMLDLTGGDVALVRAVERHCLVAPDARWTKQQSEALYALYQAVEHGSLFFAEINGVLSLTHLDGEGFLVDRYGGKKPALDAIKLLATEFGYPKPRSVKEAATMPVLLALSADLLKETDD
jgi:hypothetical protein